MPQTVIAVRRAATPRGIILWAAFAWTCASVGMATLISDAVHHVAQASLEGEGLDPPIPPLVGEVAFGIAACVCIALVVSCGRLGRQTVGPLGKRRLRMRQRGYAWLAATSVVSALITAAIG